MGGGKWGDRTRSRHVKRPRNNRSHALTHLGKEVVRGIERRKEEGVLACSLVEEEGRRCEWEKEREEKKKKKRERQFMRLLPAVVHGRHAGVKRLDARVECVCVCVCVYTGPQHGASGTENRESAAIKRVWRAIVASQTETERWTKWARWWGWRGGPRAHAAIALRPCAIARVSRTPAHTGRVSLSCVPGDTRVKLTLTWQDVSSETGRCHFCTVQYKTPNRKVRPEN